jgi:deoxyribonuclease-4
MTKPTQSPVGPRIGAHVSSAGHIDVAIDHGLELGAEMVQIFGAAPQMWRRKEHPESDVAAFRAKAEEHGIGPNFIHGVYLTNLATADPEHLEKGVATLTADMRLGSGLGVAGVIFHVGSHKGMGFDHVLPQMAKAMRRVLDDSPDDIALCIENNAGTGDSVCSSFDEIGRLMTAIASDRVKVCVDTCHAYSAGYDLAGAEGLELTLSEIEKEVGLANVVAVHANDSKTPLGSGKDRHENIGWGSMGMSGFRNLFRRGAFQNAAWMLEVPGFEGGGPDELNLDILKALRAGKRPPKIPDAPPPEERKSARGRSAKDTTPKAPAAKKPAAKKAAKNPPAAKKPAKEALAKKRAPTKSSAKKRTRAKKA